MTTKKPVDHELQDHPDPKAWVRFERIVGRMLRTPPQPRKKKGEENLRRPSRRQEVK